MPISQVELQSFVSQHRPEIKSLVDESQELAKLYQPEIVEMGLLISPDLQLSRVYAGKIVFGEFNEPSIKSIEGYQTWEQLWNSLYTLFRYGYIHTHPDYMNTPSEDDIALIKDEYFDFFITAYFAGTYRLTLTFLKDEEIVNAYMTLFASGDINFDGKVDEVDIGLIPKFLAKCIGLSPEQIIQADYDGDGKVTIKDVLRMAKEIRST